MNTTLCFEINQYAIANLLIILLLCSYSVSSELCYSCSSVSCTISSSADGLPFPGAAASPPCRSSYRSQPEYVAMKPSIATSGGPSGVSEISGGSAVERTEQATCKAVRKIFWDVTFPKCTLGNF